MGNTSYRVEEYLGYSGDEPKPRVLQKPLKCRSAHCGAMCCPAQAETCNGEPTKCFYYERRDDLYVSKSISIERTQRWIPVSERLPEEETTVLICTDQGDIDTSRIFSYSDGEWEWFASSWCYGEIIAWMPLPEPYVESEVEE